MGMEILEILKTQYQTLQGQRILLRPFLLEDAEDMFAYAGDTRVTRTLTFTTHKNIEESKTVIEQLFIDQPGKYAIVWEATQTVIGSIDIRVVSSKRATFGYALHHTYWNMGIMSEALQLILEMGFTELGIEVFFAEHYIDNPASGAVMRKVGMRNIGILPSGFEDFAGNLHDVIIYNITKKAYIEWQATSDDTLARLRLFIDSADMQIKQQLVVRFAITNKVGLHKRDIVASTLQTNREEEILAKLAIGVPAEQVESIQNIYREIMKQSRLQQNLVKINE